MKRPSRFCRELAGVAVGVLLAQGAFAADGTVQQSVSIKLADMTPVVGVKVFDNATNTLLGVTGQDGSVTVNTTIGAELRMVEPGYGQQQSLLVVKAAPRDDRPANAASQDVTVAALVYWMMT